MRPCPNCGPQSLRAFAQVSWLCCNLTHLREFPFYDSPYCPSHPGLDHGDGPFALIARTR